jgi:hypothetical protein
VQEQLSKCEHKISVASKLICTPDAWSDEQSQWPDSVSKETEGLYNTNAITRPKERRNLWQELVLVAFHVVL